MKKLIGLALIMCTWSGLAVAQTAAKAKETPKTGSTVSDTLKQIERDWTAAQKTADTDKIGQLIADDWSALGPDGKKIGKKEYLANFKSGDNKYESVDVSDMDVLVSGNTAIVQGGDTEKSSFKGKDTSGKYVWMDVFQKKDGKWQAVRSEVTKVQE